MGKETEKTSNNKNDPTGVVQVIVSIIGGIVAIIVALIGLAGILAQLKANSTPALPTATLATQIIATSIANTSFPESPIPLPTTTESFPIPLTAASETPSLSSTGVMYVSLITNQTSGNRPLEVRFDARNSYFIATDGAQLNCGACDYFWQIRKDGVTIFGPREENGVFLYTFGDRGTYYVSVLVCRSGSVTECNGGVAEINVN